MPRTLTCALVACALAGSALRAQDSTATPLDRAAQLYGAASAIRATFEQTLTIPGTPAPLISRGELFQRGTTHFALRFSEPAGDAIVSDGSALWIYLPSTQPGQVLKLSVGAGASLNFLGQLLTAPRKDNIVAPLPDDSVGHHRTAVYSLTPRQSAGAPFTRATVWIGRDDGLLWQLEFVAAVGGTRRVRFLQIHTGAAFPDNAFAFAVPPGVKIVDQAALLGGKP